MLACVLLSIVAMGKGVSFDGVEDIKQMLIPFYRNTEAIFWVHIQQTKAFLRSKLRKGKHGYAGKINVRFKYGDDVEQLSLQNSINPKPL